MLVALIVFLEFVIFSVLWLFPVVPWVGLQFVIAVFPDHIHLLLQAMYLRLQTSRSISTTEIYLLYIGQTACKSDIW